MLFNAHASQTLSFKFLYIPRASVEKKKEKKKKKEKQKEKRRGLAGGRQGFTTSAFICGRKNINTIRQ